MDQKKVYNGARVIKKMEAKKVMDDVAAFSRVLQFSTINQQHNDGDAIQNKLGRPKGSIGMVRLDLKGVRKKAIDYGSKLPLQSFQKICDETLQELSRSSIEQSFLVSNETPR
jgi:hypothetical protein